MWEIYPAGFEELLLRLHRDYQPKAILITENGMPNADVVDSAGQVNDAPRISYLERHLTRVQSALTQGVPVKGYFVWSLLDNFEWALGYDMRFGLVYIDFPTQRRIPKASTAGMANSSATHPVSAPVNAWIWVARPEVLRRA